MTLLELRPDCEGCGRPRSMRAEPNPFPHADPNRVYFRCRECGWLEGIERPSDPAIAARLGIEPAQLERAIA